MTNLDLKKTQDLVFFQIDVPLYNTRVLVSTGSDLKFLKEALKKQKKEAGWGKEPMKKLKKILKRLWKDRKNCGARFTSQQGMHHIHLFPVENMIQYIEHCAHETLHATNAILGTAGLELTTESEEAWTYLQQYLLRAILNYVFVDTK